MPLNIHGKKYPLPKEGTQQGPTGREIIEIEDYFGLDGATLLSVLDPDTKNVPKGYTTTKAIYALVWICMNRAGDVVSFDDILRDIAVDEILVEEADDPKEEAAV